MTELVWALWGRVLLFAVRNYHLGQLRPVSWTTMTGNFLLAWANYVPCQRFHRTIFSLLGSNLRLGSGSPLGRIGAIRCILWKNDARAIFKASCVRNSCCHGRSPLCATAGGCASGRGARTGVCRSEAYISKTGRDGSMGA